MKFLNNFRMKRVLVMNLDLSCKNHYKNFSGGNHVMMN